MINFLDTSVCLLPNTLKTISNIYVSPITVKELENIKASETKDDEIKYLARKATQDIISNSIKVELPNQRKVDRMLKKYSFLMNINDHRIICEAELLARKLRQDICFVTHDMTQFLFAKQMPHLSPIFYKPETKKEYYGWNDYYVTEEQMDSLFSHPDINVLNCKVNEYAKIYDGQQLKTILRWSGTSYESLKYKDIRNPYLGETIRPRNLEQKMAFDLLQNNKIKVKLLTSAWGSGKTLMALNYALEQIARGTYQRIVFVRNNIIAAGTNDIGYLPGNVRDKLSIFTRCIADHVGGEEKLEEMMDDRLIEAVPLSHIRGRSIRDSIVICDECENMDDKLVTLLMSRIEEDSELIFCGDVAQIDNKKFEHHNGIRALLNNLSGDPLFGTVKLIKSERGPVSALCDKIIPPK